MLDIVDKALDEAHGALQILRADSAMLAMISMAGGDLGHALKAGKRVFSCGNGGSMSDAMHFAEELSGRFRGDRRALPATAISDVGHLTCVANDFGYDQVFSRYLEAHGRGGDYLLAISTSGRSESVIMAATAARAQGMRVIALTGNRWCDLGKLADYHICTEGGRYADRAQELHIKVIHILIEIVERVVFGTGQ